MRCLADDGSIALPILAHPLFRERTSCIRRAACPTTFSSDSCPAWPGPTPPSTEFRRALRIDQGRVPQHRPRHGDGYGAPEAYLSNTGWRHDPGPGSGRCWMPMAGRDRADRRRPHGPRVRSGRELPQVPHPYRALRGDELTARARPTPFGTKRRKWGILYANASHAVVAVGFHSAVS